MERLPDILLLVILFIVNLKILTVRTRFLFVKYMCTLDKELFQVP